MVTHHDPGSQCLETRIEFRILKLHGIVLNAWMRWMKVSAMLALQVLQESGTCTKRLCPLMTGTDRAAKGGWTHHASDSPAPGSPIVYSVSRWEHIKKWRDIWVVATIHFPHSGKCVRHNYLKLVHLNKQTSTLHLIYIHLLSSSSASQGDSHISAVH